MRALRVPRRLQAGAAAAGLVIAGGVFVLLPGASAVATVADGYASQNGGTTGGAGGQTVTAGTGAQINAALCGRASTSTPIIIQVSGTITLGNTSKVSGSCNTAPDVIDLKGVSNVTILGVGSSAVFDQIGIHVRDAKNIVIRNVTVQNVKKSNGPTSNGGDAIGMESGVSNVWVDHNTLLASGGEDEGYDSLIDMKADTKYVTVSYNTLSNSGRGGLIGSSDSDTGNGPVTFHHSVYTNIDSRTPLLRAATAHIYDNAYVGLTKSGINPRDGGKAKVENNYFKDSKDVLGTFYTDLMGSWQVAGNVFDNVTWTASGTENHPAGPNVTSTTTISIPYSYQLDPASCVPQVLASTAGAGKGLATSDGKCSGTTPSTSTSTSSGSTTTTTSKTSSTTTTSTTGSTPTGTNLSIGAGADGSSKASGTSYGNVIDGSTSTYWSPSGSTGDISVKWASATSVSSVVIKQASGGGTVTGWTLLNADSGATLASGTSAGTINFTAASLKKITFRITAASGTPRIAEFETYAGGSSSGGTTTTTKTTTGTKTSTTTRTTTTSTSSGGGGGSTPTGSWPSSAGNASVSGTIKVSGTFDGGMKTYCCIGDGGQSESQDPMFEVAAGGTIQNVILGSPAGDGIHCLGTCTIQNVWWNDVGEDGATFLQTNGGTSYVIGGGAKSASDKLFQHNGNGTVNISGFYAKTIGKLYRSCGNCTTSYERHVVVDNVLLDSAGYVVGINTNFGDTAKLTRIVLANSSSAHVCAEYKGVAKGSEPSYLQDGWNDGKCVVNKSDVTYK